MPKHYAPIAGVNAEEFIGELPGWLFSTVKYIWRAPNKNGVEDVIKALDCLDRYIGDTVEFHNLGILSACETAIFMKSPEKAEERPHAAKQIIEALEEANKERTKQISALIDTLQETVEAMPEDENQVGVMDAIETLKGFLGWAL